MIGAIVALRQIKAPMVSKHPPGPAMTLGNMRELGVQRLVASCLAKRIEVIVFH